MTRPKNVLLLLGVVLLFLIPATANAVWYEIWKGWSINIECDGDSGFPKGISATSWLSLRQGTTLVVICHGLSEFPPPGLDPVNGKPKKVTHTVYDAATGARIGRLVTKGSGNKSCKELVFDSGDVPSNLFIVTVFNNVTKTFPDGTSLVAFAVLAQGTEADAALPASARQRKARSLVEQYGRQFE